MCDTSNHIHPTPPHPYCAAMTRKMLRKTLESHGHVVEEAENGLVAVTKVEELMRATGLGGGTDGSSGALYDVILMDFIMPGG